MTDSAEKPGPVEPCPVEPGPVEPGPGDLERPVVDRSPSHAGPATVTKGVGRAGGRARSGLGGILPGIVQGLATTARTMTRHTHTAEYPDVRPELPPRSRGVIALLEENCTSCMLCARECPDWCIYIDSHKEELPPATEGGRARQRNVLDRFAIDYSLCMYCGICVEVCPFDALFWSPEFEYAELDIHDLLHEKQRLGQWMATVPAPPALDPGSADPAEVTAAAKPARPARAPRAPGAEPGGGGAARGEAGAGGAARPPRAPRPPRSNPPQAPPTPPAGDDA
ncbi:NADH-quinone oxidoreductase subunit I [Intrasporangium sp.]|uniref:NuoI/complex I 23 kDa subunit family protein n=1 Tax=Intrasporangium sp. TaxID=1925024 RepID=UPI00322174C2